MPQKGIRVTKGGRSKTNPTWGRSLFWNEVNHNQTPFLILQIKRWQEPLFDYYYRTHDLVSTHKDPVTFIIQTFCTAGKSIKVI